MIYSYILRYIETLDDAEKISFEIETLLDSVFKTETQAFEKSLKSVSAKTSDAIKGILAQNDIALDNRKGIKNFLLGLKDQLHNLKVIKITLAFEPSQRTITNIFSWILGNIGFGIVLDINYDKTIIGGAVIYFEGKYKDFSLKKRLDTTFKNRREEIMDVYEKL